MLALRERHGVLIFLKYVCLAIAAPVKIDTQTWAIRPDWGVVVEGRGIQLVLWTISNAHVVHLRSTSTNKDVNISGSTA